MKQAIVNGLLYDVKTGIVNKGMTIVWENGKISNVGPDIEVPADASIIDAAGRYVTPGLIDSFSMIGLKEYGVRWEGDDSNEASGTIHPHLSVIDGINPFDKTFELAREYGVTTSHVTPGPQSVIGGKTAIIKTTGTVIDEMVLDPAHGLSISLGEVPKSAYREKFKTPLTRMRIAYMIRKQLRKAQYDDESEVYADELFQKILNKKASLFIRAHRADDIMTAIRIKREFDIHVVLVHATEAYLVLEDLVNAEIPVIAGPFYNPKSREELINLHPSTSKKIYDANIPFSFISNAIRNLSLEGSLSIREGIPFNKALRALTLEAAQILGISDQVGTLEKGKEADIVLWDGEPLELKTNVYQTIIGGSTVYQRRGASK